MLYTSSFWCKTDLPKYSIAISQPRGMYLNKVTVMAPPKAIFGGLKDGLIDWQQYTEGYIKHLNDNEQDVFWVLGKLPKEAVLCC